MSLGNHEMSVVISVLVVVSLSLVFAGCSPDYSFLET